LLLDPLKQKLELIASAGYGCEQDTPPRVITLSEGLVGFCAQNNEAVIVRKAAQDPRYIPRQDLPVLLRAQSVKSSLIY